MYSGAGPIRLPVSLVPDVSWPKPETRGKRQMSQIWGRPCLGGKASTKHKHLSTTPGSPHTSRKWELMNDQVSMPSESESPPAPLAGDLSPDLEIQRSIAIASDSSWALETWPS